MHQEACFVTLTYEDTKLPEGGNLNPRDLQLFLKRLRKSIAPRRIRFFAVGEYGDQTERAHYHISLFGMCSNSVVGSPRVFGVHAIGAAWGLGHVHVGDFNERTASYTAGYTVKKLTSAGDPRLKGKTPEFMRCSRNPGLGAEAMEVIADQLLKGGHLKDGQDVPSSLKLGKKNIPLGRYLLSKLRPLAGLTEKEIANIKQEKIMEKSIEMLALWEDKGGYEKDATFSVKSAYLDDVYQRLLNAETRYKIWDQKRSVL